MADKGFSPFVEASCQKLQRLNSSKNSAAPSSRTSAPPSKPPPLRAVGVARRHHSQMIRPVQVAEAIIVLVILFSLFKVVTVEV